MPNSLFSQPPILCAYFSGNVISDRKALKRKAKDMEDEQQSSSIRTTIDPEGDLVLVVEEQELLVSRNVLCLSSVVFRAMLGKGSDFLELKDQVMSTDDHQLIHLKDDNYKAVKIVACAIHMQYDMVPMEVSFEELGTIATLCDKYDLRKGLGLWPQKWSEPYVGSASMPGYERWLFIALVFRNTAAFSRVSTHLVLTTKISENGDLEFPGSAHADEGIPTGVLGM
jgi:hypothetical protein